MEDRYRNEFFTVMRTIQRITIEENKIAEDFLIESDDFVNKK